MRFRSNLLQARSFSLLIPILALTFTTCPGLAQSGPTFSGVTPVLHDVTITPEVEGTVSELRVNKGDLVQAGAILLRLDHRLEQLEVRRRKTIWQGTARLESAKLQASILHSLYNSTQRLYSKSSAVSKEEVERLQLEYERMQGQVQTILLEEKREKIEYEIARERLEQKSLRAPFAGIVTAVDIQEGERSLPERPALRLVNIDTCRFVCNIEEAFTHSLDKGQILTLHIQSGSGWVEKKGSLQVISPVADPASGLVEIEVHFDNADHAIHPGMPGRLILPKQGTQM